MAEYIDREAAIVDFERCNHENPVWTPQRVKTLLMRIPAADVEPVKRWILCSEGLPNDFEDVLCWYEYFRYGKYNRMFQTFGIGYQYNGSWGGEVSNGRDAKVLAWMPLPERPEMDGGGEDG